MRKHPVTILRDREAAASVERMVGELNKSMRALGIVEEVQILSRPRADGTVRVAMSHSMPEISALGVIARAVVEAGSGAWDPDGGGLTASVGRVGTSTSSWREHAEVLQTQSVARRLARRHEAWREGAERYGSPNRWLQLKRSQRARRRFERGYDNG